MARVFDAFDERLGRPVAVKILRPETRALPGMRQRFQQEALIAARLVHPNIVAVLDFGEDHSSSYLVMERLPGSTLRDEIIARAPLSQQRVTLVMAETLGALAAAHEFGVLHRDIKPSNILLHVDGHTKITDFGIAKSFDVRLEPDRVTDDMTMTGVVLGTPGYLAPERRSRPPGHRAVRPLLGRCRHGRSDHRAPLRSRDVTRPRHFRPRSASVACRALAPYPQDRFTSANEMLQTLRTSSAVAAPMTRPARVQTGGNRHRSGAPSRGTGHRAPHRPPGRSARRPTRPRPASRPRSPWRPCSPSSPPSSSCSRTCSQPTGPAASAPKHLVDAPTDTDGSRRLGHHGPGRVARRRRTARGRGVGRRARHHGGTEPGGEPRRPRRSRRSPSPRSCSTAAASPRGSTRTS